MSPIERFAGDVDCSNERIGSVIEIVDDVLFSDKSLNESFWYAMIRVVSFIVVDDDIDGESFRYAEMLN